ncbi:TetR/AcrR family transcriptional regulator [Demequina sp. NBRC 110053]|uniref:TetR/AcrR family transcriptional regulator n=1 Tax=Demequina sp. NBRC 110053 TaxID=1570342 RepID=UPI0013565049|nr:TetR/AcrR family transcriptional regulator [Demequina sp. NBRC 110053]
MRGSGARGDTRRDAIAAAALELYLERGFGVSIDDVAAAAGASKQTLYKFFGGRDGLARAAMELELERVIGPMREATSRDGDAFERLADFAAAYQQVLFSERCLAMYRFVIGTANESPDFGRAFNQTVVDYVIGLVTPLIAEVDGDEDDAPARAEQFIGALQGAELNRALAGATPDTTRLARLRASGLAGLTR